MPTSQQQSLEDFVEELNAKPDVSFQELSNHFDVWATQSGSSKKQLIEFVSLKTGRDYEEIVDSRPVLSGEFIDFPVVIFSPRGSA